MDKPTRGRVRKVDLLPDSIRKPLLEMLREKRLTQVQIREEINRLIREAGLPEEQQLSPAAISREASRNELIARNLRDLREQTKAMMAELGDKPTGETTALILEMSRALMYRRLRAATESLNSDSDVDMRLIKDILLSAQRAESAAERSIKREKEIRAAFAEEMANAVTDELRGVDGMSEQIEFRIRQMLLGNRYLRREQNGADIPDKGAFIDNVGLRETVNKAANALPSDGTAVAANKLSTPRNINGVPFDGTQDIYITSGMTEATADNKYVSNVQLGAQSYHSPGGNEMSWSYGAPSGCMLSGINVQDTGKSSADNIGGVYYRPVQIYIGNAWRTVSSV